MFNSFIHTILFIFIFKYIFLRVPGIPENDVIQIFGIYPWLETLLPQLILSVVLLVTFLMAHYRGKLDALKAEYDK